jgi:hypothetical protein
VFPLLLLQVRGKAAFALGQFSEYLQPEIMAHYQEVLPAIFQLLQDTTPEVQERACYGKGLGWKAEGRDLVTQR